MFMKKLNKKVLSFILLFCMIFTSMPAYASSASTDIAKNQEITLSKYSKDSDGVTVTFQKQQDDSLKQLTEAQVAALASTEQVVTFHVGIKAWIGNTATVYWEASSNLPSITSVNCTAYVESTSWLNPETYFSDTVNTYNLGGVTYTTDCWYLNYNIPSDVTTVTVGWSNLAFRTITETYTGSGSSDVKKTIWAKQQ
jgi:hypothetical protein